MTFNAPVNEHFLDGLQDPVWLGAAIPDTMNAPVDISDHSAIDAVKAIFPNIDSDYLHALYQNALGNWVVGTELVETMVEQIFQAGDYPKRKKTLRPTQNELMHPGVRSAKRPHADHDGDATRHKRRASGSGSHDDPVTLSSDDEDGDRLSNKLTVITIEQCQCCFDEDVADSMTSCENGIGTHLFCRDCVVNYVNSQVEQSKCSICCPGDTDCAAAGGHIPSARLTMILDPVIRTRLDKLQQEEELRLAGIEGLDECPFCDYKAILPPVDEDREMRCLNPECEEVSCRLCRKSSHTPMTCEEVVKDKKDKARHIVEEAMTDALIRSCNKCKQPFLKIDGCNKMTCPKCGNRQCYVCRQTIESYAHFNAGGCPQADDTALRHEAEVKAAYDQAMRNAQAANPELSKDDLDVKFSGVVERDTAARANAAALEFGEPDVRRAAQLMGGGDLDAAARLHLLQYQQQAFEQYNLLRHPEHGPMIDVEAFQAIHPHDELPRLQIDLDHMPYHFDVPRERLEETDRRVRHLLQPHAPMNIPLHDERGDIAEMQLPQPRPLVFGQLAALPPINQPARGELGPALEFLDFAVTAIVMETRNTLTPGYATLARLQGRVIDQILRPACMTQIGDLTTAERLQDKLRPIPNAMNLLFGSTCLALKVANPQLFQAGSLPSPVPVFVRLGVLDHNLWNPAMPAETHVRELVNHVRRIPETILQAANIASRVVQPPLDARDRLLVALKNKVRQSLNGTGDTRIQQPFDTLEAWLRDKPLEPQRQLHGNPPSHQFVSAQPVAPARSHVLWPQVRTEGILEARNNQLAQTGAQNLHFSLGGGQRYVEEETQTSKQLQDDARRQIHLDAKQRRMNDRHARFEMEQQALFTVRNTDNTLRTQPGLQALVQTPPLPQYSFPRQPLGQVAMHHRQ